MRKPIIAGNWKMNNTIAESIALARKLTWAVKDVKGRDILICPPFTSLGSVAEVLKDSQIALGAQDLHWEKAGAFTGEISGRMLVDVGCRWVIIGHSERRQYFGETNQTINRKIISALAEGLGVILCVGEKLEERQSGQTEKVIEDHLTGGLMGLGIEDMARIIIAYEPVWAIGTGKTASPEDADSVHRFIRQILAELFDESVGETTRIQYGGSVNPSNIDSLMAMPNIDGGLVGGASLKADDFIRIIKFQA